ncbi:putative enoyl-CoA hydratase [Caenibius tardaugens NBRC 16725]|uniref:Putative enoyl-CoA hydratase n=1 Tax=Caenibius tardaugens NBRC 16725 TaxID=1219035 RepID=U3A0D6_9SPHN|nr:enoyl-CoA hydratase family protein [Caenibius tardaugens]AZI35229.1 enoyl-CoA hydratase family protein [Caenibius tardaugens NBRC 16725]GAD51109.1 putative enoyl-CoA hydratase [Caenibius tardaugens NBRC 16725]
MSVTLNVTEGIAVVTMCNPPVNAITVSDTWSVDRHFQELGQREDVKVIILTSEGRGFNAGIDIKEMQGSKGDRAKEMEFVVGSGEACYEAFNRIYLTPQPVIAAVNGHCMGLGVGLVASCDLIVASKNAKFGLPEVDNGALGCASHLAKLVAPMKLREMSLTCRPATAAELHAWGSIAYLTEPEELLAKAMEIARNIAAKQQHVVRFAKSALNHLDVFEMHGNYRMEQGYTYQLNVMGEGSKARDAFVEGTRIITR